MVVVMQPEAGEEQVQHVIDHLVSLGFDIHRSTGASQTVLGAVGVRPDFDTRDIELLPGVREVVRITQPYKLASRAFRPEGTVVKLPRGVSIGGTEVVVAAGPCAVESAEQIESIAAAWPKRARVFCAEARSSRAVRPTPFRAWAKRACGCCARRATGTISLVVSEVMDPSQIALMLPYVDILQVGARNMQNYHLLRALGSGKQARAAEARHVRNDRGAAAQRRVHHVRRELQRDPLRARHPHLRDLHAQHSRYRRHSRGARSFRICRSWPILRTAPAAAIKFRPWPAPPSPRAPMACSSKFTTTPNTRFPTARSLFTSSSSSS